MFLDGGEFFKGDFHAHIAAADHDAVGNFQNFLDVVDARAVFDLGDEVDVFSAVFLEKIADIEHVLFLRNEGTGNEIHAEFYA